MMMCCVSIVMIPVCRGSASRKKHLWLFRLHYLHSGAVISSICVTPAHCWTNLSLCAWTNDITLPADRIPYIVPNRGKTLTVLDSLPTETPFSFAKQKVSWLLLQNFYRQDAICSWHFSTSRLVLQTIGFRSSLINARDLWHNSPRFGTTGPDLGVCSRRICQNDSLASLVWFTNNMCFTVMSNWIYSWCAYGI